MKRSPFILISGLCILTGFVGGRWGSLSPARGRDRTENTTATASAGASRPVDLFPKPRRDHEKTLRDRLRLGLSAMTGAESGAGSLSDLVRAVRHDRAATALLAELALTSHPRAFLAAFTADFPLDPSRDWRFDVARDFAIRWSELDFDAAFSACLGRSGLTRHRLASEVMQRGLATHPTEALRLLSRSPDFHLALAGSHDHTPAPSLPPTGENLELVRGLPPTPAKSRLIRAIATGLPFEEAWALANEDQRINAVEAREDAGHRLVNGNLQQAQQWHAENPDHPAAGMIAAFIGKKLLSEGAPAQAAAWAAAHTHGAFRAHMIDSAVSALQSTEPAEAAALQKQYQLSRWSQYPMEP